jgi:hypothetical protein
VTALGYVWQDPAGLGVLLALMGYIIWETGGPCDIAITVVDEAGRQ